MSAAVAAGHRRAPNSKHTLRKVEGGAAAAKKAKQNATKLIRSKFSSQQLRAMLQETRRKLLRNGNFHYSPEYFNDDLNEKDSSYLKMYAMNIGTPGDVHAQPAKKKSVRVYVGASTMPTRHRVFSHNDITAEHKNPKTRDGITRWTLCIVIFYPHELRQCMTSKLPKLYWKKAHGLSGKLTRAFEIISMFNLRYWIPPEHAKFMKKFVDAHKKNRSTDEALFRPPDPVVSELTIEKVLEDNEEDSEENGDV